jgi:hypothetical protein
LQPPWQVNPGFACVNFIDRIHQASAHRRRQLACLAPARFPSDDQKIANLERKIFGVHVSILSPRGITERLFESVT